MTLRSVNDLLKSKTWRGVPLSLSSLALDFFLLTPPCTQASMKSQHVRLNSKRQPGALPSGSAWTWWPTLGWLLQRSPAICLQVKVMRKKTNLLIAENTKRKNQEQFKHSMLTLENSFTSSGVECNGAGLSGCGVRDIEALEWDFLTRGED